MKKVLIAPNAFKGSLSAPDAAAAMARGIRAVFPEWELIELPLADGGDGTTECVIKATGGSFFKKKVTGTLGGVVEACWGLTGDHKTAVVEVAAASGLALFPYGLRNPMKATTYGTGELIREALQRGCQTVFLGLGGSATNDAGAGILQALGVRLLNACGEEIGRGACGLKELEEIDLGGIMPELKQVELVLGCDVDNPLFGPEGAAYVYAPQKGASPGQLPLLDDLLRRFAGVVKKNLGHTVDSLPGGGAAGGIGAGLAGVLGAKIVPGIEKIFELTGLNALLASNEIGLVVTGEGEINEQSLRGKLPVAVSRLARSHGIPVLLLAGSLKIEMAKAFAEGVSSMLSIVDGPISLAEAMSRSDELLRDAVRRAMLLIKIGRQDVDQGGNDNRCI